MVSYLFYCWLLIASYYLLVFIHC